MRKLGPGMYVNEGDLHIDIIELLAHYNIENTQRNRDLLASAAMDAAKEIFPEVPQTLVQMEVDQ